MLKKKCKFLILGTWVTLITSVAIAQNITSWSAKHGAIATRWAKDVKPDKVLPEYPRPQLVREKWINLNGLWDYSITAKTSTGPTAYAGKILVPYPLESALSGVKKFLQPDEALWYKRSFATPPLKSGEKLLLHFGAVDFESTIYINGKEIALHKGGYQQFSVDVTTALKPAGNDLVVKVSDPSDKGPNPHGKQVLKPEGIMYTPSSGIWQTVWLETVPATYIRSLKITPDIDKKMAVISVALAGAGTPLSYDYADEYNQPSSESNLTVEISVSKGDKVISSVKAPITETPSIKMANPRLWSPDDPFLYDLQVKLLKNGKVVDEVTSYLGMRKISVQKDEKGIDRIFLNNRYTFNLGTLDQGFWPDGLYTAPTDAALKFDIEAAKAMGFNTIRKHIKIEPDRWYYHADKIGMLVWQDMVNPGNDTKEGRDQFERENKANVAQLFNHPSIITWVLFNEKWGQYDQERLTKWFKSADPTRIINGHSGEMLYVNNELRSPSSNPWIAADMTDVHSYPFPRNAPKVDGKVRVLGEFGGIGVPVEGHLWNDLAIGWGYDGVVSPPVMQKQYTQMVDSLKVLEQEGLSASIYTQPFDVESEQNGIITYDRSVIKLPVAILRAINARVWPATANYVSATKGFNAVVADTGTANYQVRLKAYMDGKRDSAFLRRLAVMATANHDTAVTNKVAREYISLLKNPLHENNLRFIRDFTTTTADPGFTILLNNIQQVNEVLGKDEAESKITGAIEREIVTPKIPANGKPDWQTIEQAAVAKYGDLGQEIVWQTKVFYAVNHKDWDGLGLAVKAWFPKYGSKRNWINAGMINALAWAAFENSNNRNTLEAAIMMTTQGLKQEELVNLLDTHANLLYKIGNKREALKWQEKAVVSAPGDAEIQGNFEKMQRGEPTWPNIN